MPIVRTSSKGQIVIPKKIREKLGIVIRQKGRCFGLLETKQKSFPYPMNLIKPQCGYAQVRYIACRRVA